MTAIVKHERGPEPPQTYAGYLFPGLGHLLVGEWVHGIGMMSVTSLVAVAVFHARNTIDIGLHAAIATIAVLVMVPLLWYRAHRRVFPKQLTEEEYHSNRNLFLRQITRHRSGMIGFYGISLLLLAMALTPFIAPFDPDLIDAGPGTLAPGWWQHLSLIIGFSDTPATHGWFEYLLGTDERGRDVLSRLLYGARISLLIGFFAVSLAASIGTVVGATAGYLGGWVDRALMWFVDLLLAMPRLILLLAVVGIIDLGGAKRLFLIIGVLGLTGWMGVSRIVRSQVLSLKQQDFIQAARALGYSQSRIVIRHLIPNAMAPVIVFCSLAIGSTMLAEAGLSFLGLGVQPPTSTWGVMVNAGRPTLRDAPWISLFPGIAIVIAVMSFNLLGDGLRDALDPKQRT